MLFSQQCTENPKLLSPLTLAFIGDGVYELMVREELVRRANVSANKLHKAAVTMVRAETQAALYEILEPILSEEELTVMKRGRNANSTKAPQRSNPSAYRKATGVESLFGYLYLMGNGQRLEELFSLLLGMQIQSTTEKSIEESKMER